MGLDMYVYQTCEDNLIDNTQFSDKEVIDCKKLEEVWYWRGHPRLHKWFEKLYLEKGGKCEVFNGEYVKLTIEDINKLEKVLRKDKLTPVKEDLQFICKARKILKGSNCLIYSSFW